MPNRIFIDKQDIFKVYNSMGARLLDKPFTLGKNYFNQTLRCKTKEFGNTIIKIGLKEGELTKLPSFSKRRLNNEYLFFLLVKDVKLPFPKVIAYDQSKSIIPNEYFICHELPGKNWGNEYEQGGISFQKMKSLYQQLGKCAKTIHNFYFDRCGQLDYHGGKFRAVNLTGFNDKTSREWPLFFHQIITRQYQVLKRGPFACYYNNIRSYVKENFGLIKRRITPTILHGDLEPWNILITDGKITGILDGELSFVGHYAFDLVPEFPTSYTVNQKSALRHCFMQGYFGQMGPSNTDIRIIDFYRNLKILFKRVFVWENYVKIIGNHRSSREIKLVQEILRALRPTKT